VKESLNLDLGCGRYEFWKNLEGISKLIQRLD